MCSEKFIHTVSNFRSDSRIEVHLWLMRNSEKDAPAKRFIKKKIESSFSNPREFTNFVRKRKKKFICVS